MATLLRKAGTKTVQVKKPLPPQPAPFALDVGMSTAAEVAGLVRDVANYLMLLEAPHAQGDLRDVQGRHAGSFSLGPKGKLRGPPSTYLAGLTVRMDAMPRRELLGHLQDMADRIEQVRVPPYTGAADYKGASLQQILKDGNGMFWFTLEE
jgi:hypothetical protein